MNLIEWWSCAYTYYILDMLLQVTNIHHSYFIREELAQNEVGVYP